MAATASFKQQCPSCEAWVPVRDPNLIGRKIDCPKCKYRFVVEDPGTDAADEEQAETEQPREDREAGGKRAADGKGGAVKGKGGPRRRDGDDEEGGAKRKRRKESGGGSTKLILGVGLGVVAVGILVAVAIFMYMNSEAPKSAPQPSTIAVNPSPSPAAPGAEPPAAEPAAEEGEKPTPAPAAAAVALPVSTEVLTNLLPPDTEGVCSARMKDLIRTSLGRTIFGTPGAFRSEAIQQRLGVAVEEIDLLVQAWNFTQNWSFNVIHTTRPINHDAVRAALRTRPAPEGKIEDQEYFLLDANPWLDSLGNMSFATLLQINPTQVPARSGL
jgi:flagellar basal body-associated protein FliL